MLRRVTKIPFLNSTVSKRFSALDKSISADAAVAKIKNGSTIAVGGFVCVGCAEELCSAIERRFEKTGEPKDLTVFFQGGPGDFGSKGLNHFAKEGMVRRVICGHLGQAPALGKMALDNKIETYILPMGALSRMMRCGVAGQPAHITPIGTGTMVDPAFGGGKVNAKTKEDLVSEIMIGGKRYLSYKAIPIDVAFVRGTYGDIDGNIAFTHEPLYNDNLVMAMAARATRGLTIAQVEQIVAKNSLSPKEVLIPGTMVTDVVKAKPENHTMGYFCDYDPSVSGETRPLHSNFVPSKFDIRKVIARRASFELRPNMVVNLGIGMPDGVGLIAGEEGISDYIDMTSEPGIHGGVGLSGHNFGPARNHNGLLTMDHQFDFYNGGGLDIAFLGSAETEFAGHINVTRMGNRITGPGGFIDITQSTHLVNFLGSFTANGLEVAMEGGKLIIVKEGKTKKYVNKVREISFSGTVANEKKQSIQYISERCVFRLTPKGLELTEIAPGIDIQKNILDQMEFKPLISKDLKEMDASIFKPELMNLKKRYFENKM